MLFENNNDYLSMFLGMQSLKEEAKVYSDDEGFLRGNMFPKEYVPYKNLTYIRPKVKGPREKDLMEIMEVAFAINDFNLYLDVHPNDTVILNKYKMYAERLRSLTKEFEEKYGPLCITSADYSTFKWIDSPWPWEREDGKYV